MCPAPRKDSLLADARAALDLATIGSLFEQHLNATAEGPLTLRACRRLTTNYSPGETLTATYELETERAGEPTRKRIGVAAAGRRGLEFRLLPNDPDLPGLATAMDAQEMAARLSALQVDLVPEVLCCEVEPVSYKPGRSCVLRYRLQTMAGDRILFGKLVARQTDALWSTVEILRGFHEESELQIPEPIAYWADLRLLAQAAVDGSALGALLSDDAVPLDDRIGAMRSAGRAVATLHSMPGAHWGVRTMRRDLDELRSFHSAFELLIPELNAPFTEAADCVARRSEGKGGPVPVPSHGALRTDQLLIAEGRVVAVDLDEFCVANPARDMSNLLAYLNWRAIRHPESAPLIDEAEAAFLEGYGATRPAPDGWWLDLYHAVSLLKIAGRRLTGLSTPEWHLLPQLLEVARSRLRL